MDFNLSDLQGMLLDSAEHYIGDQDHLGDDDTHPARYHRRSLVETKMHCFKLLGQRAMVRTFDRQITELKVRAAIPNRFSQIGTPNRVHVR